jgi:glycosyltransferase involved in cell wall biosynthesis
MKILTTSHYIADFTVPLQAKHSIERTKFPELGRFWSPAMAVAAYLPGQAYDLAHFINKIPLSFRKPWVVTFESALPRMFPPQGPLRELLRNQLSRSNCVAIIPMSLWALTNFKRVNAGWAGMEKVFEKTQILHPALKVHSLVPRRLQPGEVIQVVFIGNCFARKGGIVALRLAKKAIAEGIPVHIHIVSSQMIYSGTHTDHPDPTHYAADLRNMHLPNVTFHGALNNQEVLNLMSKCHVNLLATLHDTYGFSVLEGFSNGLPVISSNVCALPEFVFPGPGLNSNGFLLKLPKQEDDRWRYVDETHSSEYWEMLDESFESMADQALLHLQGLAAAPERLEQLSRAAIDGVAERHNPARLAEVLDTLYRQDDRRDLAVAS